MSPIDPQGAYGLMQCSEKISKKQKKASSPITNTVVERKLKMLNQPYPNLEAHKFVLSNI